MNNKNFENLSDEIKAKLSACKTDDEMKEVLEQAGVELDADVLEAVSGGVYTTACRGKKSFMDDQAAVACVHDSGGSISQCLVNRSSADDQAAVGCIQYDSGISVCRGKN